MPFYQRGFLYLFRKRAKSILLLLVFLLANSMILGTNMILHAAKSTETAMQEKTKAKVVCEITDPAEPITGQEAEEIQKLDGITAVNRMGQQSSYLTGLVPVTGSDSAEPENRKVSLLSFDDMETDGPFADQSYRLTDGRLLTPKDRYRAVVNEEFARANGLSVGDTISFETEEHKKAAVEIAGEYLTGNEAQQEKSALAVYRMENQIYIDNTAYLELFGSGSFYKVSAYVRQPELLETLEGEIQKILSKKAETAAADQLYQQMKAPLTQITQVISLMRLLAFATGTAVVSLLLCMWMRSRQKEMAVLISMGEQKSTLCLQALLETAVVFLAAAAGSCVLGAALAGVLQKLLLSFAESGLSLQVSLQLADLASLLGIGGAAVVTAVFLSLLPVLRGNPKELLSRMEG